MFLIVAVPTLIGMIIRKMLNQFTQKFEPIANKISLVLFLIVLLGAIYSEKDNIVNYFVESGFITLSLNLLMMIIAFFLAHFFGSGIKQKKTNCKRIVIYGPESTGKTTLAYDLANYYKTSWAPEYAREYLQRKWDMYKEKCNLDDLINIALGQIKEENKMISKSRKFIFCDTNVLVTKAWSETYFEGYCPAQIKNILK